MKVKTTGIQEMNNALRKYELVSSKTREAVLLHRANRFAWSLFGTYQQEAKETKKKIKYVSARRLKVRHGTRSKRQEKARRIFAAGYASTGWIPAMRKLTRGGTVRPMAKVENPQGSVIIRKKEIILINSTPGAWEADKRHNLSNKAARKQAEDMQKYLQRQADKDIKRSWK